jgi:hypothetical protein
MGATTVSELAALLARCQVLVTNDTGPMHVAAAVGTRVVDISTGPVFVHETGPYGDGHFVIESRLDCFPCVAGSECCHIACRDDITPEDVAALTAHAVGLGPMPRPPRAKILRGRFLANGRIEFECVWPAGLDRAETLRAASAVMWEDTLSTAPAARPSPTTDRVDRPQLPGRDADTRVALWHLARQADAAADLARRLGRSRGSGDARLPETIDRQVDGLIRQCQAEPACRPIADYLRVRIDSTRAREVVALARTYEQELRDAAQRARRLGTLLEGAGTAHASGAPA